MRLKFSISILYSVHEDYNSDKVTRTDFWYKAINKGKYKV